MRYRDKQTGHFVSKATWKRSKAHGGKRYVRVGAKKRPSVGKGHLEPLKVRTPAQVAPELFEDFDEDFARESEKFAEDDYEDIDLGLYDEFVGFDSPYEE